MLLCVCESGVYFKQAMLMYGFITNWQHFWLSQLFAVLAC